MLIWVVVLVPLVLFGVLVGVSLVLRPQIQRRLYPGLDIDGWRREAKALSWRDRWELYRAAIGGRATTPRLAALAVRRGELLADTNELMLTPGTAVRRLMIGVGGLMFVLGLLQAALLVLGELPPSAWVNLSPIVYGPLFVLFMTGRPQRWNVQRFRRSVEANRRLLEELGSTRS